MLMNSWMILQGDVWQPMAQARRYRRDVMQPWHRPVGDPGRVSVARSIPRVGRSSANPCNGAGLDFPAFQGCSVELERDDTHRPFLGVAGA